MAVMKVIELVGTSKESWQDAVEQVVAEASSTLRDITGVDVLNQTAHVENGKMTEYRANVRVAFRVEHGSYLEPSPEIAEYVGSDASP